MCVVCCTLGRDYYFTNKQQLLADVRGKKFLEAARVTVHSHPCNSSALEAAHAPPQPLSYWYGTSLSTVREVAATGKLCVMSLDVQGAKVRHAATEATMLCSMRGCIPTDVYKCGLIQAQTSSLASVSMSSCTSTGSNCASASACKLLQALRSNPRIDGLYLYISTSTPEVLAQRQKQRLLEADSTLAKRLAWAKQQVAKSSTAGLFDNVVPNTTLAEVSRQLQLQHRVHTWPRSKHKLKVVSLGRQTECLTCKGSWLLSYGG
jgi:guanylate kinase